MMIINGYSPPKGPICPKCGSILKTRACTRTMGYGGKSKYTENSWECPNNCIITPRTICIGCGSLMIVEGYKIPSRCSVCGITEPYDHTIPEPKPECKMKCKYCGDIQILNKKSFEDILENGCDRECWGCMKRGYEPVIIKEPFVLSYENLEKVARNHPYLELVDGKPKKDCWLCEGTGYVMKDRQTGEMFGKDPCIDWSKKDHNEYRCPNCNDVKGGVLCGICDGTGVLGDCIGICEPPNRATHLNQAAVPQCDECDPKWRD